MASGLEPIPVTPQKHDLAWKHCQMFKNGDRIQLRCLYCGKMFKGGGIHRIKEHLAGQKGNAATCLRVQPDVRLLMQESLNGVVVKKRKKQKLAEDISNFDAVSGELDTLTTQCGLNTGVELIPVPDTLDQNSNLFVNQEEETSNKTGGRKKKGRVRKSMASSNPNNVPANSISALELKRTNNQVHMAVGRFFYDVGIALDAVNSVFFQPMIDAIASQGAGVVGPSYHDMRNWILKNSVQEVKNDIDQCIGSWGKSGCSILVEEWISEKGSTLVNLLVYCPEGTTFLRSVDISEFLCSADAIYDMLRELVEEVGVRNVLQVITNSEERYVVAGKRLTEAFPNLFWTPCAAHCIDLMLEDFRKLDWISTLLEKAKSISKFIYNHTVLINMMRRYTYGVDLVDVGVTRSVTDFATLKRMANIKHNLHSMVTSEEWMECPYSKKQEGLLMLDCICSVTFWSACSLITRLTDPLLRLIRIVSSEKRPAIGYVYAGIYRAKETLKKEIVNKKDFSVYWNIIDHRWAQLQRHSLLGAGFYLNPKFFYSTEGDIHLHIQSFVNDCVEKLVPEPKIQDKILKEITSYQSAAGDFGRKMAIRARDTLLPSEWWSTYGGGCPNLARLAIRILSQTCSLICCRPNQSPFQDTSKTKNCLEHQRLKDLAFVQYNLRLRVQLNKGRDLVDPISSDHINMVEDWVVEKDSCSEDFGSSDWTIVEPPFANIMVLGPAIDDVEALGVGFDDYEFFVGANESEDENGEGNVSSHECVVR